MQAKNIQLLSRLLQEGPKSRRSKCIEREGGHDEAEHVRSVEVRLEKKEVNNANPQLPTKLNFLVCCVAGGRPPSPPERNVDGRGESSMKFFFFSGHAFGTNFACKGGGDTTSSFEAQKIKKLSFVGGGCIFFTPVLPAVRDVMLAKVRSQHMTLNLSCALQMPNEP